MTEMAVVWECVWVDDGSNDRTAAVVQELGARCPNHRLVRLDGNFGQSAALWVGFREARHELVATLDGDGQNDPADIPGQVQHLLSGQYDLVNGVRATRRDTFVRRVSSRLGNGFRNLITRERVTDVGCSMRVFRRHCVQNLPLWKGMHRFLPTLVRMQGYAITEVPVNHRPRTRGVAKYGIGNRLWVGLADCFAVRWMQWRMVWPKVRDGAEG